MTGIGGRIKGGYCLSGGGPPVPPRRGDADMRGDGFTCGRRRGDRCGRSGGDISGGGGGDTCSRSGGGMYGLAGGDTYGNGYGGSGCCGRTSALAPAILTETALVNSAPKISLLTQYPRQVNWYLNKNPTRRLKASFMKAKTSVAADEYSIVFKSNPLAAVCGTFHSSFLT